MTREILDAINDGNLYDYIANNYYAMSKSDLKDVILELEYAVNSTLDEYDKKSVHDAMAVSLEDMIEE